MSNISGFDNAFLGKLAQALNSQGLALKSDVDRLAADIAKRAWDRAERRGNNDFSISKAVRGLLAMQGRVLATSTRDSDVEYAQRALSTGSTPGSYLVPQYQASEIIEMLSSANVVRQSGARRWIMSGREKLTIPAAVAAPTAEWLGENTQQSASDANLGQLSFDLKTLRCLTKIPNELLTSAVPNIDQVLTEIISLSFAQEEVDSFFSTTQKTNGPMSVYAASGTTKINAASNNANGGNLLYTDLLAVLQKFAEAKAAGATAWYMAPRTFFQRILGLLDGQSRPVVTSDAVGPIPYRLFGAPVYVSAQVPTNQAVGSGTNQSYLVYTNPRYVHIADQGEVQIDVSRDFAFDFNQTSVRGVLRVDNAFGPAAGCVILAGIN